MNPRNNHSYIILLAILAKGADVGTTNLVFLIVLGICAIFYLVVIAISSGQIDIFLSQAGFWKKTKTECWCQCYAKWTGHYRNQPDKAGDRQEVFWQPKRETESISPLYQDTLGPYITEVELSKLVHYVECYAWQQPLPDDLHPVKPERLKNADLFHFGWNMANYYGQRFRATFDAGRTATHRWELF